MAIAKKGSSTPSSSTKKSSLVKKNVATFIDQAVYQQRIAQKAYELYIQRGAGHGNDLEDWYQAEKIIGTEIK